MTTSHKRKPKLPTKKQIKLAFFCLLFLSILFIFRNFVIKQTISLGAQYIIGTPVRIEDLSLNIPEQKITAKGIKVYNPKDFIKKPFIEINEAKCEINVLPILWGKIHIPRLYLDIKAVTLIKNTQRVTNVDSLKLVKQIERDKKKKHKFEPFRMEIDILKLNIEKLIQINHRKNNEPLIKVYEYPIRNKAFRNITSAEQLVVLIIAKAIGKATIRAVGIKVACAYLGVNSLPVSIAGIMLKKDNTAGEWPIDMGHAYRACLDVIGNIGELKKDKRKKGILKAKIYGARVTIRITEHDEGSVSIRVYARKYCLARRDLAAGVLYQIALRISKGFSEEL